MRMRDIINLVENASAAQFENIYWYHGSEYDYEAFDTSHAGKNQGKSIGLWFTDNPDLTGYYGSIQYKVKLHLGNCLVVTPEMREEKPHLSPSGWTVEAYRNEYDSVLLLEIIDGDREANNVAIFDESAIKLISKIDNSGE